MKMAAERIVSTSSSNSSLNEEMDEKQSCASSGDGKENSKGKESSKKDSKKLKSSKKDRRDPKRFLGEGVNFKAKLIGVRDVPQARGEKMAQETLQELKAQKKSTGEHKQKIVINISLEGLKIKEEKTKEILYFHEVHKISFISQDASDNRAFGYIYGSPDNLHTFYAVKTEKAAQQIVMCMRDLFQIAFELKKKEIEQWRRQQIQQPLPTDRSPSTSLGSQSNDGSVVSDSSMKSRDVSSPSSLNSSNSSNFSCDSGLQSGSSPFESSTESPQNSQIQTSLLLDLNMEGPLKTADTFGSVEFSNGDGFFSDPWGYLRSMSKSTSMMQNDPFGVDSFEPVPTVVPPPTFFEPAPAVVATVPSGQHHYPASDPFNTSFVNTPYINYTSTPGSPLAPVITEPTPDPSIPNPDDKYAALAEISNIDIVAAGSAVTSENGSSGLPDQTMACASAQENSMLNDAFAATGNEVQSVNTPGSLPVHRQMSSPLPQAATVPMSAFSDLDPLGKDRPYIDKKDFFHDLKNPPKKVLKDLIPENAFVVPEFEEPPTVDPTTSSCPPTHAPPPLPPPFFHHSLASPSSSLDDASMADSSSASTTSSIESDSPSPVGDVLLPPPPPPRPINFPAFLPPPPPLPPKHGSGHSSRSSDGSGSPTSDFPPDVEASPSGVMTSTPPIPIPTRRSRPAFVSSSSTSTSSSMSLSSLAQHYSSSGRSLSTDGSSLADPNNNPPPMPARQRVVQSSSWADSTCCATNRVKNETASWNDIKRAAAIIAANNRELSAQSEMDVLANRLNATNPFGRGGDVFLSPPPQTVAPRRTGTGINGNHLRVKRAPGLKPDIFEKDGGDPFEDDDFFAALRTDGSTAAPTTTVSNDNKRTQWTSPFDDNFAAQKR